MAYAEGQPGGGEMAAGGVRAAAISSAVGPMVDRMHEYLKNVSMPALGRAGVKTVGAFTPQFGPDSPSIFFLLAYSSIQDFMALDSRLNADAESKKAAESHATLPASDPAYVRIDSQLMLAVPFMRRIEVPAAASGNKPRVFELRTYESHSKRANKMKLEMFGDLGRVGDLPPHRSRAGLLREQPGRTAPAEPDLHARVRRSRCARKELGIVRRRSRVEDAEPEARLHGSRNRLKHHVGDSEADGIFTGLTDYTARWLAQLRAQTLGVGPWEFEVSGGMRTWLAVFALVLLVTPRDTRRLAASTQKPSAPPPKSGTQPPPKPPAKAAPAEIDADTHGSAVQPGAADHAVAGPVDPASGRRREGLRGLPSPEVFYARRGPEEVRRECHGRQPVQALVNGTRAATGPARGNLDLLAIRDRGSGPTAQGR